MKIIPSIVWARPPILSWGRSWIPYQGFLNSAIFRCISKDEYLFKCSLWFDSYGNLFVCISWSAQRKARWCAFGLGEDESKLIHVTHRPSNSNSWIMNAGGYRAPKFKKKVQLGKLPANNNMNRNKQFCKVGFLQCSQASPHKWDPSRAYLKKLFERSNELRKAPSNPQLFGRIIENYNIHTCVKITQCEESMSTSLQTSWKLCNSVQSCDELLIS